MLSEQAFLIFTFSVQAVIAGKFAFKAWRRRGSWKSFAQKVLAFLRWTLKSFISGPASSADSQIIHKEVLALRYGIGRKIVGINTTLLLVIVLTMQLRLIFRPDLPALISPNLSWTIAGHLSWMTLAFVVPQLARSDLWFSCYSLLLVAYVLPYADALDGSTRVALIVFSLFRFPAVVMARRVYTVLLGNIPFAVALAYRTCTEQSEETYAGIAAVVGMECLHLVLLTAAAFVFEDYLARRVELDMERGNALTQLNAAIALLQLTCDAVVELDADFRLTEHSRELAAMLLRDGGRGGSLQGMRFVDLMPAPDAAHALTKLSVFRSSGSGSLQESGAKPKPGEGARAHAFHTRLMDSWSTKVRTEVLQVMYRKMDGQTCHLVGLRDFTDSKPYAAAASLSDEDMNDAASVDSFPVSPSSRHSEQWQPTALYHRGMLFLDVDVERLCINASSAPLMDLVGSATSAVFPAANTLKLMDRIHSEGRLLLERGEQPPSKVYSFDEMPACLGGPAPEPITGTMHLIQAQVGLNVLVAFQPSAQVQFQSQGSGVSERRSSRRLVARNSSRGSAGAMSPTLQDLYNKRHAQLSL